MLSILFLAGLLTVQPQLPPPPPPVQPPLVQPPAPAASRLQVFLDCTDCFASYLREETPWVDFVRDRSQAEVHVIITDAGTGSGGRGDRVVSVPPRPVEIAAGSRR